MHDETFQHDIQFDRLVDGELSAGERRALLESLDTRPDGWRQCALAFLEAQLWRKELGQVVREYRQPAEDIAVASAVGTPADRKTRQHGMAWLAVAAGLLVALTLGVMQRNDSRQVVNNPSNGGGTVADAGRVLSPAATRNPTNNDALTFWVHDDAGQRQRVRVPLVDAGALDRELGVAFQSGVPADVRAQLRNRGYDVQSQRRYAPLSLENGRRLIVPVEDTKIVPVSQKVY